MSSAAIVCSAAAGRGVAAELRRWLGLSLPELASLYRERDPATDAGALTRLLSVPAQRFRLSGVDLLRTEESPGAVVLEVNSAPGFAYCTPERDAMDLAYRPVARLVAGAVPVEERRHIALLTEDKLPCETEGFQRALSEMTGAPVPVLGPTDLARAVVSPRGDMTLDGRPIRGGLRYLHAAPWRLLPPHTRGGFVNGTDVDLAGARDKVAASEAFSDFNNGRPGGVPAIAYPPSWSATSPEDLQRKHIAFVAKARHLNSGAGVFFQMPGDTPPDVPGPWPVLVQSLVLPRGAAPRSPGHTQILSRGRVHDIRVIVGSDHRGFFPLMLYSRLARAPFHPGLRGPALRDALLTNIAVPDGRGGHRFEYERLIVPDEQGFGSLGLSASTFAVLFVQAALATAAVASRAETLSCAGSPV